MSQRLLIGAMSGTSADGVDVALVRFDDDNRPFLEGFAPFLYPPELRETVLAVRNGGTVALSNLADLGRAIGGVYADAVFDLLQKTNTKAADVTAIAAHGQTLFHDPPRTIQWIDPAVLAFRTGIDVIHDFRRADCAAGGQGAPLVPLADATLFGEPGRKRLILNIGGIANVTALDGREVVCGFDTGPGNCLSDFLMAGRGGFDAGGTVALSAKPDLKRVADFLASDYFAAPPPKSTDGPAMVSLFEKTCFKGYSPVAVATAAACCWASIVDQVERHVAWTPRSYDAILAGGGLRNAAIVKGLRDRGLDVCPSDDFGIPAPAREAMAFAILGAATLDRKPGNVVTVTGASRPVVLGAITPRP